MEAVAERDHLGRSQPIEQALQPLQGLAAVIGREAEGRALLEVKIGDDGDATLRPPEGAGVVGDEIGAVDGELRHGRRRVRTLPPA